MINDDCLLIFTSIKQSQFKPPKKLCNWQRTVHGFLANTVALQHACLSVLWFSLVIYLQTNDQTPL